MLASSQMTDIVARVSDTMQAYFNHDIPERAWADTLMQTTWTDKQSITLPFAYGAALIYESRRRDRAMHNNIYADKALMTVRNFKFGTKIDRYDIKETDVPGYLTQAQSAGRDLKAHPARLLLANLRLGQTSAVVTYDGQNFFSATHNYRGNAYSNIVTGTGTTLAQLKADLQTAQVLLAQMPSEYVGETLGLEMTDAIYPQSINVNMHDILFNKQNPESGYNTENYWAGQIRPQVSTRLGVGNDWYAMCNNWYVKPFIWVRHEQWGNMRILTDFNDSSPRVIDAQAYLIEGEVEHNVQPSYPFLTVKVDNV